MGRRRDKKLPSVDSFLKCLQWSSCASPNPGALNSLWIPCIDRQGSSYSRFFLLCGKGCSRKLEAEPEL